MDNQISDTQHRSERTMESPMISFAHLDTRFYMDDGDASAGTLHGFPFPQEEELYETGILSRIFLKC